MNQVAYPRPSKNAYRWLAVICVIHALLALLYALIVPPLEKLDEEIHWDYIRYLREEKKFPNQFEPYIQENPAEFHQPPFYYLTGVAITAPVPLNDPPVSLPRPLNEYGFGFQLTSIPDNTNRFLHSPEEYTFPWHGDWLSSYLLRFWSIIQGVGALIAVFWLAWHVFENETLALGSAAWLAFRPSVIWLNSSLSNDPLILLFGTAILAVCARMLVQGPRRGTSALLGVLLALTAMTKFTWIATALAVPFVFFIAEGFRQEWKKRLGLMTLTGGLAFGLTAWWFIRNQLLYGEFTGMRLNPNAGQGRPTFLPIRSSLPTLEDTLASARLAFIRYYAHFDIRSMPEWTNVLVSVIGVLLLLGLAYVLLTGRFKAVIANRRAAWFTLGMAALYALQLLGMFLVNVHGFQPRYAIGGYGAMAVAMQLGLVGLVMLVRRWNAWEHWSAIFPALIFVPLSIYAGFGILLPSYAAPHRVSDPTELVDRYDTLANVQFGDTIRLIGYQLEQNTAHPGETIFVTMCFESAGPLSDSLPYGVHAANRDDFKAGERNTHPGLGMYPTEFWEPGVYFCDRVRVPLRADAPAPDTYTVSLRYFNADTQEILPATLDNGTQEDAIALGEIVLLPEEWPQPGESLYLVGSILEIGELELLSTELEAGKALEINVTWQTVTDLEADYTVFVHVLDASGNLVAQRDTPPLDGRFPTGYWPTGAVVQDHISVPLNDVNTGEYRVLLGIYETETVTRLSMTSTDNERLPDDVIQLGTITVR